MWLSAAVALRLELRVSLALEQAGSVTSEFEGAWLCEHFPVLFGAVLVLERRTFALRGPRSHLSWRARIPLGPPVIMFSIIIITGGGLCNYYNTLGGIIIIL